jgi:hypothetical protein
MSALSASQFKSVPVSELMNYQSDHGDSTVAHAEGFTNQVDQELGRPMDYSFRVGRSMSIRGQKEPVQVIEHPDDPSIRKVINGHHRIYGAMEVGIPHLQVQIHKPEVKDGVVHYPELNREGFR